MVFNLYSSHHINIKTIPYWTITYLMFFYKKKKNYSPQGEWQGIEQLQMSYMKLAHVWGWDTK